MNDLIAVLMFLAAVGIPQVVLYAQGALFAGRYAFSLAARAVKAVLSGGGTAAVPAPA